MRKVIVIGSPGSGKSRLAAELAQLVELPAVHLDALYHDPQTRYDEDVPAWRRFVTDELIRREAWVMDGHYPATFESRLAASDTVVYLDYPTHTSLVRAVNRRLRPPRHRPDMPREWKERLSWSLVRSILLFRRGGSAQPGLSACCRMTG